MTETIIYEHHQDRPDSIEIGPAGGRVKVYFNAARPAETDMLIKNALEALIRAKTIAESDE